MVMMTMGRPARGLKSRKSSTGRVRLKIMPSTGSAERRSAAEVSVAWSVQSISIRVRAQPASVAARVMPSRRNMLPVAVMLLNMARPTVR